MDYYEWVTLMERDLFSLDVSQNNGPTFRKGVAQARYLHSLVTRGGEIVEQYFPGLEAELTAGRPALDKARTPPPTRLSGVCPDSSPASRCGP